MDPSKTLSEMIDTGELDAIQAPHPPSTFYSAPDRVKRLFENYVEIERAYFRKTKIFPIMHTVAIRREVYEQNRWIAQSLYKAFVEAQRRTYEDLRETAVLKSMLPFLNWEVDETIRMMGDDYWAYGLEKNMQGLETFLKYH